ncbi:MAG: hypothetical protein ABL897_16305 [Hyphomicrobium sp.]
MRRSTQLAMAVIFTAGIAGVASDAHSQRWNKIGVCKDAVEGAATSTGILGLGSARAREAAQSNWEINVEDKYGPGFANFAYARDVQWDCKKGAVLLAKCVVVAKPCGARLRG